MYWTQYLTSLMEFLFLEICELITEYLVHFIFLPFWKQHSVHAVGKSNVTGPSCVVDRHISIQDEDKWTEFTFWTCRLLKQRLQWNEVLSDVIKHGMISQLESKTHTKYYFMPIVIYFAINAILSQSFHKLICALDLSDLLDLTVQVGHG